LTNKSVGANIAEGSSATDSLSSDVTDVTDVTDVRKKEEGRSRKDFSD